MNNNKIKLSAIAAILLTALNANADQVILDDLIIDGSSCIGMDCVNGESFGFDTLRLKENNLRIRAVDTSSTASFPSRDWQITFNDSSNGGANKFSIDDIDGGRTPFTIEAGAPYHSLYVDDGGRLGLGTSTPVVDVHVRSGNTPTLRLEQDGTSGFTPQTWDVAGNEANFFVRDATNGSTLPFRIYPGAPTSSLTVSPDGDVGLGTTSPNATLDINGKLRVGQSSSHSYNGLSPLLDIKSKAGEHSILGINTSESDKVSGILFAENDAIKWFINSRNNADPNPDADRLGFANAALAEVFTIQQNGNLAIGEGVDYTTHAIELSNGAHLTSSGVWTNASSKELKHSIKDISANEAINALNNISPVTFIYNIEPNERYAGFIAEDVPELVATSDRKSLASMDITAMLTKVVQEQQYSIARLEEKIIALEKLNQ